MKNKFHKTVTIGRTNNIEKRLNKKKLYEKKLYENRTI